MLFQFKNEFSDCSKCNLPICSEDCSDSPNHTDDCQPLSQLLREQPKDAETRFLTLAPCIGAIRLIRLKKKSDDPVNQLISGRDDSFQLPDWEEQIVKTLTNSKFEGAFVLSEI